VAAGVVARGPGILWGLIRNQPGGTVADRNQGARPTKAERREEARRQRVELERRQARAKRSRWIAIVVALVVVAGAAAFMVTRPDPESVVSAEATQLLAGSAADSAAAGCTEVADVGPYQPEDLDQAHVGSDNGPAQMPGLASYPSRPPASGPHAGATLPAGVYSSPPAMDALIHSLEHGAAIVWYAPGTPSETLSEIEDFYRDPEVGSRVIVAPYDYPDEGEAGALAPGTGMALVSWHHTQTCTDANLAAAFGFTARYAFPTFSGEDYLGTATEPGAAM
jgi:hypothetical protein